MSSIKSALRSLLSLVLLVFALTNLYNTAQGAYHYNETLHTTIQYTNFSYWEALVNIMLENLVVTIIAFLIVIGWVIWEVYSIRQDNKREDKNTKKLDEINESINALVNEMRTDREERNKPRQ